MFKNWCLKEDNEKFIFFDEIIKAVQDDAFILSVFCIGIIYTHCTHKIKSDNLITYIGCNILMFVVFKFNLDFFEKRPIDKYDLKIKKILQNVQNEKESINFVFGILGFSISSIINCIFGIKDLITEISHLDLISIIIFITLFFPTIFTFFRVIIFIWKKFIKSNKKKCIVKNYKIENCYIIYNESIMKVKRTIYYLKIKRDISCNLEDKLYTLNN